MKSSQDRIPTYQLSNKGMALDSQGRVLRKPHFLTKEEHDASQRQVVEGWKELLRLQELETATARENTRVVSEMKIDGIVVVHTKVMARKRLHWMVRWLVRLDRL